MDVVFRCLYKQNNLIDYNADKIFWIEASVISQRAPRDLPLADNICMPFPSLMPALNWLIERFTSYGFYQAKIKDFVKEQTRRAMMARKQLNEMRQTHSFTDNFDSDNFKLSDGTQFKRSVIDFIIDSYLDGKLNRVEDLNSCSFPFLAADKTVNDAMAHSLHLLATDQQAKAKLRESIHSSGMDSQYLMWVINKSLRLHPLAPVGCSRTISRDIKLAEGYTLPAGTYVHTPLYTIHRHKAYWGKDTAGFRPERWEKASEFHPMQFILFGGGIISCPGKELALFEMKMLLTTLLVRYKFECQVKDNIGQFDMLFTLFIILNSQIFVKLSRL